MGDRQQIQDHINQYIVSNSKQAITGEKMNIILNEFASKIKFFKDENSIEKKQFNGMKSFLYDFKFFSFDEGSFFGSEARAAPKVSRMLVDQLDQDLCFYDPFYFSNLSLEEARTIIQLQAAVDMIAIGLDRGDMFESFVYYFQQMGTIRINSPYTRAAFMFYAARMIRILSSYYEPENGGELISFYLGLIFPPFITIQTPFEQVCRLILVAQVLRYIAINPDSISSATEMMHYFGSINFLDHPMVNVTRNYVVGVLMQCISKNQENEEMFKEFFRTFAGPKLPFKTIEFNYTDGVIMSAFLSSWANNPDIQGSLVEVVNEFTNLSLESLPVT